MAYLNWHGTAERDLYGNTLRWVEDDFKWAICGSSYVPDVALHLQDTSLTNELTGLTYPRLSLTGKTRANLEALARLRADDATLAAFDGAARTVVLVHTATGRIVGSGPILDSTNATDLDANGGPIRIRTAAVVTPPPASTSWVATSPSHGMGVSMAAPTPSKVTAWGTATSTTPRMLRVFMHNGLSNGTTMTQWLATGRNTSNPTTGVLAGLSEILLQAVTPPLRKFNKKAGETSQAQIGHTPAAAAEGAFDTYYKGIGTWVKENGLDVPWPSGLPRTALTPGQENNLPNFPGNLITDTGSFIGMMKRYIDQIEASGMNWDNVPFVFSVNTRGQASRSNILTSLQALVTAYPNITFIFEFDWYDVQVSKEYTDDLPITNTDVDKAFDGRAGNADTTKDSIVSANWGLQVAQDLDILFSLGEWGCCATDRVNFPNAMVGGGDQARYFTRQYDWQEAAIQTNRIAYLCHYVYNSITDTGVRHDILTGPFPLARAEFLNLWGD